MLRNVLFAFGIVAVVATPVGAADLPPSVIGVHFTLKNNAATQVRFTVSLSQQQQFDHSYPVLGQPPTHPTSPPRSPQIDPKANPPQVVLVMPGHEVTVTLTGFGNRVSVGAEILTPDCCSIRGNVITRGHASWDGPSDKPAHLTLHEHGSVFTLTDP